LLQNSVDSAVRAAARIVEQAGADMVKVDGAADFPEAVTAIMGAGIPVFGQFELKHHAVDDAKRVESAGASLIDFKHSGPVAGPAVVNAVSIPVLGGMGGGPWLDGRIRMAHAAIGYAAGTLGAKTDNYANVAEVTFDALTAYAADVREGRQIKGGGGVTF